MMFRFRQALLMMAALCVCSNAQSFQSYQVVGEGNMRWLFFALYEARLLSPDGEFKESSWPVALEITYQRDIKKSDLVKTTEGEWIRMNAGYEPGWLDRITEIWPDVRKNDVLLFHVDADGRGLFYYNGKLIGGVDSPAFSRSFLDIWLSEKARDRNLRDRLLGAGRRAKQLGEG